MHTKSTDTKKNVKNKKSKRRKNKFKNLFIGKIENS